MLTVIFLFPLVAALFPQDADWLLNPGEKRGNRLCGEDLSSALKKICNGMYSGKRSIGALVFSPDGHVLGFPFYSKDRALLMGRRRRRRGITEECCRSICTFDELKEYCQTR